MLPQAIKTRNRSQDEPMAEIESGQRTPLGSNKLIYNNCHRRLST